MAGRESPTGRLPLLFYADGYKFPDVYHLTRFLSPDPIIALEDGSEIVIVASSLEEGRVRKQSRATSVFNIDAFGAKELSGKGIGREELDANVIARFLESRGTKRVAVAPYFPLGMAERLGALGIELVVANDLAERRRAKRPDEVDALDGEVFTAERLRAIVEGRLLELGCVSEGAIVAPGPQAADPHMIGTGPLHANEPIVMDIFPQHKTTRYYADMTRTVSKGAPADEI